MAPFSALLLVLLFLASEWAVLKQRQEEPASFGKISSLRTIIPLLSSSEAERFAHLSHVDASESDCFQFRYHSHYIFPQHSRQISKPFGEI